MFNSHVLEVGIGLIFTFLAVSLITGAIVEAIGSWTRWRANVGSGFQAGSGSASRWRELSTGVLRF